jgi:hypothetical protein
MYCLVNKGQTSVKSNKKKKVKLIGKYKTRLLTDHGDHPLETYEVKESYFTLS